MSEEEASAPPRPLAFAALRKLQLLDESEHEAFFAAVAAHLSHATPVNDLDARFKLGFSEAGSDAAALLMAVTAILNRVAARTYAQGGRAALGADLVAAGLNQAATEWLCGAAEAAALPCAADIRRTQAHVAAALSHSYLEHFDWQASVRTAPLPASPARSCELWHPF